MCKIKPNIHNGICIVREDVLPHDFTHSRLQTWVGVHHYKITHSCYLATISSLSPREASIPTKDKQKSSLKVAKKSREKYKSLTIAEKQKISHGKYAGASLLKIMEEYE